MVHRPHGRRYRGWLWSPPALGARSAQWALSALAFAALSFTPPAAAEGRRVRNLTDDIATTGIERVEVRLPIASVRIEPSPDDRVHVDLEVRCSRDSEHCRERAERLTLESNRDGTTLRFRVEGMESLRSLCLKVRGHILVPNGKAIDVNLPLGELQIRGVTGDLDVDVAAARSASCCANTTCSRCAWASAWARRRSRSRAATSRARAGSARRYAGAKARELRAWRCRWEWASWG
jgi:hypothetical protein